LQKQAVPLDTLANGLRFTCAAKRSEAGRLDAHVSQPFMSTEDVLWHLTIGELLSPIHPASMQSLLLAWHQDIAFAQNML
jgi:hypothetical protein